MLYRCFRRDPYRGFSNLSKEFLTVSLLICGRDSQEDLNISISLNVQQILKA